MVDKVTTKGRKIGIIALIWTSTFFTAWAVFIFVGAESISYTPYAILFVLAAIILAIPAFLLSSNILAHIVYAVNILLLYALHATSLLLNVREKRIKKK